MGWTCHICERVNPERVEVCPECRTGWHAGVCEVCGKESLRPLIHVVPIRQSTTAMWDIKAVGINHIGHPHKRRLIPHIGKWVCFRCQAVDSGKTHYADPGRRCQSCNSLLRETNVDFFCEACRQEDRTWRKCPGCGHWLKPDEFDCCRDCAAKRVCRGCGGPTDRLEDFCVGCREDGIPGNAYLKTLADERHRPIPPPMYAESMDRLRGLIRKTRARLVRLSGYIQDMRKDASVRRSRARWCKANGRHGEAAVLEAEASKIDERVEPFIDSFDRQQSILADYKMAGKSVIESGKWHLVVPGRHAKPSGKPNPTSYYSIGAPDDVPEI